MPWKKAAYPPNWLEVRRAVLRRAGGAESDPRVGARCEWCGVRNYSVGYHRGQGFVTLGEHDSYREARRAADEYNVGSHLHSPRAIVIVLTVAHVNDPDPQNVGLDNLAALCQRCHNRHDRAMRAAHAAQTRRRRLTEVLIEAGQLRLPLPFGVDGPNGSRGR